jgi:hypothetical protein
LTNLRLERFAGGRRLRQHAAGLQQRQSEHRDKAARHDDGAEHRSLSRKSYVYETV